MKRRYGMVFGAAVITILMISNATALTQEQIEILGNEQEIEAYDIDSETYLTTDDLPILYACLLATDDPEIVQLIQNIIDIIENQGFASIEDIEQLELPGYLQNSMEGDGTPIGIISATDTNGVFQCAFRLIPRWIFCGAHFLWQITLFSGGSLSINGQRVYGPNHVSPMLFIGYACCNPGWPIGQGDPWIYKIRGIGFMISVDDVDNQQSNPETIASQQSAIVATPSSQVESIPSSSPTNI